MSRDKLNEEIWNFEFQLFGGPGVPPETFDGRSDGLGHSEQRYTNKPTVTNNVDDFSGKQYARIIYNTESHELSMDQTLIGE